MANLRFHAWLAASSGMTVAQMHQKLPYYGLNFMLAATWFMVLGIAWASIPRKPAQRTCAPPQDRP
jgi:hypothetical protein